MAQVLHCLPGRLRLQSATLKRRPDRMETAVDYLLRLAGVRTVRGNTTTGTLTIGFDQKLIRPGQILGALSRRGFAGPVIRLAADSEPRKALPTWVAPAAKIAVVVAIQLALPKIISHVLGKRAGHIAATLL